MKFHEVRSAANAHGHAGDDSDHVALAHQFLFQQALLRYFGQAFEVRVPLPDGPLDAAGADEVARTFHAEHQALYGYDFADDADQQVEWVNLRVTGIGPIRRPEIVAHERRSEDPPTPTGTRAVCFDAADGFVPTQVFWRPDLQPGDRVHGPVVVEEFGSTVPVHPGFTAEVDPYLNLVVRKEVRA